jgi:hypothetical protein
MDSIVAVLAGIEITASSAGSRTDHRVDDATSIEVKAWASRHVAAQFLLIY